MCVISDCSGPVAIFTNPKCLGQPAAELLPVSCSPAVQYGVTSRRLDFQRELMVWVAREDSVTSWLPQMSSFCLFPPLSSSIRLSVRARKLGFSTVSCVIQINTFHWGKRAKYDIPVSHKTAVLASQGRLLHHRYSAWRTMEITFQTEPSEKQGVVTSRPCQGTCRDTENNSTLAVKNGTPLNVIRGPWSSAQTWRSWRG